ncbi:DNA/RNA non-specific endonuclease [Sphingomonas sp.]|uniref:LysM peptidoglycan-binding domain-containing protein n=1 Tax=Sphingomonas sp. TaxID=28214 RepID=UPI003BA9623B
MKVQQGDSFRASAFGIWMRFGQRGLEFKFNPWYDSEDGRFTFVGQGNYFPRRGSIDDPFAARGGYGRGPWTTETDAERSSREDDPRNPRNHSVHTVQAGESLTSIARRRKGLRVSDLAWLNGIDPKKRLRIGQRLMLPHQQFLDAGRDARNKFLALAYYQQTHGGRLPPNPANPPSLERQILDSNWRRETLNGYDFQIDVIDRPRITYGTVSQTNKPKRSRRLQARAGGADRRPTDDGGHFWAARFDGPLVRFNHFAQDANFNRGAYRAMEDAWAAHRRAGRSVFASIKPYYSGASRRPYKIVVTWSVDGGRRETRTFWNEAKGKPRGAK